MPSGTLELTLRPLKFAFLVDPADHAALNEAIEINTFLWGGMFNPIIPVFRKLPPVWRERFHRVTAQTLVAGYLDTFDPDIVVTVGNVMPPKNGVGFRDVIPSSEILAEVKENGAPKYGLGLTEVLKHFAEEELQFVRHRPLSIRLPEWDDHYALFFAAAFGAVPNSLAACFREKCAGLPGIEWKPCSLENFALFLEPGNLFLRRLGSLHIHQQPPNSCSQRDCIFFMDVTAVVDIIDYWNLRAAGWNVVPAPKQAIANEDLQKLACEFIGKHCYPRRGNPQITNTATLLKSRCTSEADMKAFWDALKGRKTEDEARFRIDFQTWLPPFWHEWFREYNNAGCSQIESQKSVAELHDVQGFRGFTPLAPVFASRFGRQEKPRFANRVEFRIYGGEEPSAEAIPEAEPDLEAAFDVAGEEGFRFSRHGPLYLATNPGWWVHISVPKAEEFFGLWLAKRGWTAELSDKGYVAKQMLRQLGGVWGTQALADEGTLSLMAKLEGGKVLKAEAFRAELHRICAGQPSMDADKLARRLVDLRAVQLGLELQCPHCRQRSWHSIKDADYELGCPKCLQKFSLPSHAPKEIAWSYRSTGPFSLPQRAFGAYSVLLTLRFFARVLKGATTPLLSFTAKKAGAVMEADLALFFQESEDGNKKTALIFAECKTKNEFARADADRMSALAKHFPGAVLVFATLNKSLNKKEQGFLRPVVNRGRRLWKTGHPFNPVLILTAVELLGRWRPRQTWRDTGGKHALFADYHSWPLGELLTLCEKTQQIYLDLPPGDRGFSGRRKHTPPTRPPMSKPFPGSSHGGGPGHPLGGTKPLTAPAP